MQGGMLKKSFNPCCSGIGSAGRNNENILEFQHVKQIIKERYFQFINNYHAKKVILCRTGVKLTGCNSLQKQHRLYFYKYFCSNNQRLFTEIDLG